MIKLTTERLKIQSQEKTDANRLLKFNQNNEDHFKKWGPLKSAEFYNIQNKDCDFLKRLNDESQLRFLFCYSANPENVIGEIGFSNIVRGVFQNCNLSYKIDKNEQGKGLMSEALAGVIEYIFTSLNLHRIEANVSPNNTKSISLLTRLNFTNEGISKELLYINNE